MPTKRRKPPELRRRLSWNSVVAGGRDIPRDNRQVPKKQSPFKRNPLSWLRSGGGGITILDWSWVPDLLLGHELIAEDLDLGTRLEAALKPEIWVRGVAA